MGALKDAATAAATPQPSSVREGVRPRCRRLAAQAPSEAPRCTTGPSRPTEAPAPMETALTKAALMPSISDMRPPRKALASITSATPWGRRPGMRKCTNSPIASPPAVGTASTCHHGKARAKLTTCSPPKPKPPRCTRSMIERKPMAAPAAVTPMATASNERITWSLRPRRLSRGSKPFGDSLGSDMRAVLTQARLNRH